MKFIIPQTAALLQEDSPEQTKGCRHTNPEICSNNSLSNVCAFSRPDGICKKPPRSWKKIYEKLLQRVKND